jgi:hypothetical protein
VSFSFDAERHEYRLEGQLVPSCTGLLSSGGLVQFGFISADLLERKSELGRQVHQACHLHNLNKLGSYDERVKPHLHAWIKFKEQTKFNLISSAYQTIASINGMSYGMESDCNALVDGHDTIIELKTGRPYPHHGVQLAGYSIGTPHPKFTAPLARFMSRKRMVVELRANGTPKVHEYSERSDYDVFSSLLYVATWKRRFDSQYQKENV